MAVAGAMAGEAAGAGSAYRLKVYRLKRLGPPPARKGRRAVIAAVALLAVGGVALASATQLTGHDRHAGAAPSQAPARSRVPVHSRAPARSRIPGQSRAVPARPAPSASPRRAPSVSLPAEGRGPAASLQVAGVGCPGDGADGITVNNAPTGPGWMPAAGGWTGNGCDGSALWTMEPHGKPAPSTLTWSFTPAAGTVRCTLAVFVPTQNALGVSDYSVSIGPAATSQVIAAIPVSQPAKAGQWLTLGTFPATGSPLEITTVPVPGASGPGHHGAIAASAASAHCT